MLQPVRLLSACTLLLAGLSAFGAAHAAQSYDACGGRFIDSLPATITTQGVWCMRKDLATAISDGNAITVAANNVTIDCNDYKLGGLAAGAGSVAYGIRVQDRHNATIRHCNIRGFRAGVIIDSTGPEETAGHVVQDNRFEGNLVWGIAIDGENSVVERNQILDTGGSTITPGGAVGIAAWYGVDLIGNLVSNVAAVPSNGVASASGIQHMFNKGSVVGNRVRGLVVQGGGTAVGIHVYNADYSRASIRDNDLIGSGPGTGVLCLQPQAIALGNVIGGFATAWTGCTNAGNHVGP